jgi:hypothetical protein
MSIKGDAARFREIATDMVYPVDVLLGLGFPNASEAEPDATLVHNPQPTIPAEPSPASMA